VGRRILRRRSGQKWSILQQWDHGVE
jgi:hypothetical protein